MRNLAKKTGAESIRDKALIALQRHTGHVSELRAMVMSGAVSVLLA